MTWQLYLVEFKSSDDLIQYRSLDGDRYWDSSILQSQAILPGRHTKILPHATVLSLEVHNYSYTLHLNKCRYDPQKVRIDIVGPDDDHHSLNKWSDKGFESIQFRALIVNGQYTLSHVTVYIHNEPAINYRLCWWDTSLGEAPFIPES